MENFLKEELNKLKKQEHSIFADIQDSILDGLCFLDLENLENEWTNNSFWRWLGYSADKFNSDNRSWKDVLVEDDLKHVLESLNRHLTNPDHLFDHIIRFIKLDGDTVWAQMRGVAIRNKSSKPIRMLIGFFDITKFKETEKILRESEDKYRLIVQNTSDVIWIYNISRQVFTYISPSVFNLRGFTAEEAMQMNIEQALTNDSAIKAKELISLQAKEFMESGDSNKYYVFEFQQPCKNGDIIWIEASATYRYSLSKEIEVVGISRNITQRKKVEADLIEKEKQYKTLFEKSLEPIAIMKGDSFVDCNQAFLEVLKIKTKNKLIGINPWQISPDFQPDGKQSKLKALDMLDVAYKRGYNEFEWLHSDTDGQNIWLHVSLARIKVHHEDVIFVIYRNITQQKKIERRLIKAKELTEESEKRFKKLFVNSNTAVILLNRKGVIVDCNNAAITLFRYTKKEEMLNIEPWQLSPEFQPNGKRSDNANAIDQLLERGLKESFSFNWLHQDSDGRAFDAEINFSPIRINNKQHIYVYIRDITYETLLRKSESDLKKANEDKNRFFSVLAHDLRGSIGGAKSIIEILKNESLENEEKEKCIGFLNENINRSFDLLTNLISWGKATMNKEPFIPEELGLYELIGRLKDHFKPKLDQKGIILTLNCSETIKITADKNMVETIFRNLISNSIKYSHPYGEIVCSCYMKDGYLEAIIRDNGVGMPRGKAKKLFNLEYIESVNGTTGEKGTGLGLQLVKQYIDMHSGSITAESEAGIGTSIIFKLPASS